MSEEKTKDLIRRFGQLFGSNRAIVFECDSGWYAIINDALQEINHIATHKAPPGSVEVTQIKEKFGGLRIYTKVDETLDNYDEIKEDLWNITHRAEQKSFKVCEITGEPGKCREVGQAYKTISDTEYDKYLKKTLV